MTVTKTRLLRAGALTALTLTLAAACDSGTGVGDDDNTTGGPGGSGSPPMSPVQPLSSARQAPAKSPRPGWRLSTGKWVRDRRVSRAAI